MKKQKNAKGFSLVELMIVLAIIAIGGALAFWGLHSRASHFRLASSTRDLMGQMKLAQASAIRANTQYRLDIVDASTFKFEQATGLPPPNDWAAVDSSSGALQGDVDQNGNPTGQTALESGATFPQPSGCGVFPCNGFVTFRTDGTLTSGVGQFDLTDGNETFRLNWTLGGSIRITQP